MLHASFLTSEEEEALSTGSMRQRNESLSHPKGEHDTAADVIAKEMAKNENIAQFEEIKVNTEIMLGVF